MSELEDWRKDAIDRAAKYVDFQDQPLVVTIRKQGPEEKEQFVGTEYYRATFKRSMRWPCDSTIEHTMDDFVSTLIKQGWITAVKIDRKSDMEVPND